MKVTKVYLDDRGILVPGHLIERAFCKSGADSAVST